MFNFKYKKAYNEDAVQLTDAEKRTGVVELDDLSTSCKVDSSSLDNKGQSHPCDEPQRCVHLQRYFFKLWAVISTLLLLVMVIVALVAHSYMRNIKWCCVNNEEYTKCQNMSFYFNLEGLKPNIECFMKGSIDQCIIAMDHDDVDTMTLSHSDLYKYGGIVKPVLAEEYSLRNQAPTHIYGHYHIAVIHNNNITNLNYSLSISGLRGAKLCIGNWRTTAGFMAYLNVSGFSKVDCELENTLSRITTNICAPDSNHDNLCYGCKERKCPKVCGHGDLCGDSGAISCMTENFSNIAFTSSTAFEEYLSSHSNQVANDYQLICADGSRAPVHEYRRCHVGFLPSQSVVISNKLRVNSDVDIPFEIVEVLHVAQLYFGNYGPEYFNMFRSFGSKNIIFEDQTQKLVPLRRNCTSEAYLGKEYFRMQAASRCHPHFTSQEADELNVGECFLPAYKRRV